MHEILRQLAPGARVLDLGSSRGSFDSSAFPRLRILRADLERPSGEPARLFVQADAARMPFPPHVFDAVICNHSLEHFAELDAALAEIGRVLKPLGAFYASLPDASTFSDRLYRKLASGGGHLNPVTSVDALVSRIAVLTGLAHRGTRPLLTSLSFLNSRNGPVPKPVREVGADQEGFLVFLTWLLHRLDRLFGTRLSVYGWALYFGTIRGVIDERPWSNICVRCGSAHPSRYLVRRGLVTTGAVLSWFHCPGCGARNLYTAEDVPKH